MYYRENYFSVRLHHKLVLSLLDTCREEGPIAAIRRLRDQLMYGPVTFGLCELKVIVDTLDYQVLNDKVAVYVEVQAEARRTR